MLFHQINDLIYFCLIYFYLLVLYIEYMVSSFQQVVEVHYNIVDLIYLDLYITCYM